MNFEEARKRAAVCNGRLSPKKLSDGSWLCDNCGVGLTAYPKNRIGFKHQHVGHNEKRCLVCNEIKLLQDFYVRPSSLDNYENNCKECCRKDTNDRRIENMTKGRSRYIWLPNELWAAVHKVRGKTTFRDFVALACRKEVERRLRDIALQNAVKAKSKTS